MLLGGRIDRYLTKIADNVPADAMIAAAGV
jgi:hypothetical protein